MNVYFKKNQISSHLFKYSNMFEYVWKFSNMLESGLTDYVHKLSYANHT